jgi:hypothetical protein
MKVLEWLPARGERSPRYHPTLPATTDRCKLKVTNERAKLSASFESRDFVGESGRGVGSGSAWSEFFARLPGPSNMGSKIRAYSRGKSAVVTYHTLSEI